MKIITKTQKRIVAWLLSLLMVTMAINLPTFGNVAKAATANDALESTPLGFAGERLGEKEQIIYKAIRQQVEAIGAGECESTTFTIPVADILGSSGAYYTAEDLGVDSVVVGNAFSTEAEELAKKAFASKLDFNSSSIISALIYDYPEAMYWYGSRKTIVIPGYWTAYDYNRNALHLYFSSDATIQIKCYVNKDYAGADDFKVDLDKIAAANVAIANAKQIVKNAEGMSDFEKLEYYRDEICELTTYYDDDFSDYSDDYGNPWELVWVFDGDPNTNVVCEGYAKAFQYLCKLTQFDSDICSYIVTGDMSMYSPGEGPHMWNIVHMDDNRNYLVDITNVDDDSYGTKGYTLFLKPVAGGSVEAGYYKFDTYWNVPAYYSYDNEALELYSLKDLTLSEYSYGEVAPEPQPEVQPVFKSASLYLGGNLGVAFHIDIPEEYRTSESYMKFTINGKTTIIPYEDKLAYKNPGIYEFILRVNSIEIADMITAEFYYGADEPVSIDYSVKQYIDYIVNHEEDYSQKDVELVKAISTYGACAQAWSSEEYQWKIGEDHSTIDSYADYSAIDFSDYAVKVIGSAAGVNVLSYSAELASGTNLKFYFKVTDANEHTFTVNGAAVTPEYDSTTGRYIVSVNNIAAHQLATVNTIQVDGGLTIKASVFSYANSVKNMNTISDSFKRTMDALYMYYINAMAYIGE